MPRFLNPPTVPSPMSRYSQAVLVASAYKRVIISGQVGADSDGILAEGLEAQIGQAFDNFLKLVEAADLGVEDIVRINAYCTVKGSVGLFRAIREAKLGKSMPAATYVEVLGLASPLQLFEIEGEALREAPFGAGAEAAASSNRRRT